MRDFRHLLSDSLKEWSLSRVFLALNIKDQNECLFDRFTVRIKEAFGNIEILLFDLDLWTKIIYTIHYIYSDNQVDQQKQIVTLWRSSSSSWLFYHFVWIYNLDKKKVGAGTAAGGNVKRQLKFWINGFHTNIVGSWLDLVVQNLLNFVTFNKKTTEKMNFRI
jgi:hypothetical protein